MLICNYLQIDPSAGSEGPAERLKRAILDLWDKTADDADRLVSVLDGIRGLRGPLDGEVRNGK